MRRLPVVSVLLMSMAGAAWAADGPPAQVPDALQEGTMANEKLQQDALTGVVSTLAVRGCESPQGVTPYLTKAPSGQPGQAAWQEVWLAQCANGAFPIRIDFSEDGKGGANWTVRDVADTSKPAR